MLHCVSFFGLIAICTLMKKYLYTLFHKFGSPKWFYQLTDKMLPWFAVITAALLIGGAVWGLAFAPVDYKQGNSYRIIFIHVPAAFISLAGYYVMAIAGAVSLIWKMKLADVAVKCAAPIGAAMTLLALITGATWGKPTWGTWWVWDARNTSMLVLLFLYLGISALYEAFENEEVAAKACAVLALVGTVNIPIIYKSVDWWYSLHQPASLKITEPSTMHPSMWQPLVVMIVGFYVFYATVLMLRMRTETLIRYRHQKWVKAIILQSK
nr:heme ABC transporter permease [Sinobacterium caligoides]